jgi:hypothetical protein
MASELLRASDAPPRKGLSRFNQSLQVSLHCHVHLPLRKDNTGGASAVTSQKHQDPDACVPIFRSLEERPRPAANADGSDKSFLRIVAGAWRGPGPRRGHRAFGV